LHLADNIALKAWGSAGAFQCQLGLRWCILNFVMRAEQIEGDLTPSAIESGWGAGPGMAIFISTGDRLKILEGLNFVQGWTSADTTDCS